MQILNIFVKNPQSGKVKTRLAATVGAEEALRIYQFLLEKTREITTAVEASRWLWYSTYLDKKDAWDPGLFLKKTQVEGDLGQRMNAAFELAFEAGAEKALLIGSDCPYLSAALLTRAFEALDTADVVLGPASDGGYYLLGLKQAFPMLFDSMTWSTDTVCMETLRRIEAHGLSCTLLEQLDDIDEEADWHAFQDYRNRF